MTNSNTPTYSHKYPQGPPGPSPDNYPAPPKPAHTAEPAFWPMPENHRDMVPMPYIYRPLPLHQVQQQAPNTSPGRPKRKTIGNPSERVFAAQGVEARDFAVQMKDGRRGVLRGRLSQIREELEELEEEKIRDCVGGGKGVDGKEERKKTDGETEVDSGSGT